MNALTTLSKLFYITVKQVFKRLHLGTVSFGTDSMEEVGTLDNCIM